MTTTTLLLAFLLGIVAGLRVLTAPAALFLARGGIVGYILAVGAVGEYIADMMPNIPSRIALPSIVVRPLSGAVVGWFMAGIAGACAGVIGALLGTYGGYAARVAAIAKIGAIPAALIEDIIAVALAAFVVTS